MLDVAQLTQLASSAHDEVARWKKEGVGASVANSMKEWVHDNTTLGTDALTHYGPEEFGRLHHALENLRKVLQPILPPPPSFMVTNFAIDRGREIWAVLPTKVPVPLSKIFFIGPAKKNATEEQVEAAYLFAWRVETDWILAPILAFLLRAAGWDKLSLMEYRSHRNPILQMDTILPLPKDTPQPPDLSLSRRTHMLGFQLPQNAGHMMVDTTYGYNITFKDEGRPQAADSDLLSFLLWRTMVDTPRFAELMPACVEAVGKALLMKNTMKKVVEDKNAGEKEKAMQDETSAEEPPACTQKTTLEAQ
jgi:hypothetical protein